MSLRREMQLQILRVRYLFSKSYWEERKSQKRLRKAVMDGFRARRYVRLVSTIELGNFPHGVSDIHAVTAEGEILHPEILFPDCDEDDLAVALGSLRGRRIRSEIGPVPNPIGSNMLLQRVIHYTA